MPSPSGVDLRANVESKRDALCRLFQDYDHGRVGADGLQAGLARLDVFATRAYLLALSKPPLRLATFLHALTVPDSTRFKLDGADPMNFVKRLGSIDTVRGAVPPQHGSQAMNRQCRWPRSRTSGRR